MSNPINFYRWNETDEAIKTKIMRRAQANIDGVIKDVLPIIEHVRQRGDKALIDFARRFDNAELTLDTIKANEEDFDQAEKNLDEDLKAAIKHCANNVKTFHKEQIRRMETDREWMIEIQPGVFAGEKITPIDSVGLYIPRGKGAFPSAMYMLGIPAVLANVPNIVVVTPPTPEGNIDAATLYTAKLCGIQNVYKAGGAQAIAALAYGTNTIPPVKKILGPGSPYVAAAKNILSDIIDPGMPAGPSESIILCDETANPHNTCLDLLNEAEHGQDSAALLLTHDEKLAAFVQQNLQQFINDLPDPHRNICQDVMQNYGSIILTDSLAQSIALSNDYAPEHLHLKVKDPDTVMKTLKNAGEILIGEYTPSTLGNYGIGVNHVLPTGGWAHSYSCTTIWDFLKRTSISKVDAKGFEALKDPVLTLTDYENFPAHGDALRKRKAV